ncbi:MFS transporter [Paenibacillus thalictri]|uniref:MFS transporter n=1 Tax=Paenibacillus thalictri TaxID=2527873 RepID=A0A4Q9DW20_9BACL|nr:MFS transporter [Paenibacillus thalictri]TBL79341.1 MFS transporter [Paenibacillus thalictri]
MNAYGIWKTAPPDTKVLLAALLFVNLGFYSFIPYLSIYLTGSFGWSLALTGLLLGVRQMSQQGVTFLGGLVADRLGCKPTLIAGLLLRSVGFCSFAFCGEIWQFFASAVLSGLGGALFEPAFQAAFAKLTPQDQRKSLFSFKNMLVNIAMIASSLLGSVLLTLDFKYLSITAGIIYFAMAFFVMIRLKPLEVDIHRQNFVQDIHQIVRDVPFVIYTLVLIGYYFLYMQLYLTIPKAAALATGDPSSVAYIYAAVSISVIVLQLRVTRYTERFANRFMLIGAGSLLMGLGLLLFGSVSGIVLMCACSVLFALGTMVAAPLLLDVIPSFAPPDKLASYYGFNGYAMAVGGALSTSLGGWLYDAGSGIGAAWLPWVTCFIISLAVAGGFYFYFVKPQTGRPLEL